MRLTFRKARYWLWAFTRDDRPDRLGDAWADRVHREVEIMRAEKAATADATNPHKPVVSIDRPAIWIDTQGRTVIRDRFGTRVDGIDITYPTTEMENV